MGLQHLETGSEDQVLELGKLQASLSDQALEEKAGLCCGRCSLPSSTVLQFLWASVFSSTEKTVEISFCFNVPKKEREYYVCRVGMRIAKDLPA